MIERRSILKCLVGLVAAPAIIKVSSLMPVNAGLQPGNGLLTIDQITREAVRLFQNNNRMHAEFVRQAHEDYAFTSGEQWPDAFAADGAKIGDTLRIRLPNDFVVSDGPSLELSHTADAFAYMTLTRHRQGWLSPEPVVPVAFGPLALAAAAVAVAPAVLERPVTRRFWAK